MGFALDFIRGGATALSAGFQRVGAAQAAESSAEKAHQRLLEREELKERGVVSRHEEDVAVRREQIAAGTAQAELQAEATVKAAGLRVKGANRLEVLRRAATDANRYNQIGKREDGSYIFQISREGGVKQEALRLLNAAASNPDLYNEAKKNPDHYRELLQNMNTAFGILNNSPDLQKSNSLTGEVTAQSRVTKVYGFGRPEIRKQNPEFFKDLLRMENDTWRNPNANKGESIRTTVDGVIREDTVALENLDANGILKRALKNYNLNQPEGAGTTIVKQREHIFQNYKLNWSLNSQGKIDGSQQKFWKFGANRAIAKVLNGTATDPEFSEAAIWLRDPKNGFWDTTNNRLSEDLWRAVNIFGDRSALLSQKEYSTTMYPQGAPQKFVDIKDKKDFFQRQTALYPGSIRAYDTLSKLHVLVKHHIPVGSPPIGGGLANLANIGSIAEEVTGMFKSFIRDTKKMSGVYEYVDGKRVEKWYVDRSVVKKVQGAYDVLEKIGISEVYKMNSVEAIQRAKALEIILAYQITTILQGATGGRTISDQDVAHSMKLFGGTFITRRDRLARISLLKDMLNRNIEKGGLYRLIATKDKVNEGFIDSLKNMERLIDLNNQRMRSSFMDPDSQIRTPGIPAFIKERTDELNKSQDISGKDMDFNNITDEKNIIVRSSGEHIADRIDLAKTARKEDTTRQFPWAKNFDRNEFIKWYDAIKGEGVAQIAYVPTARNPKWFEWTKILKSDDRHIIVDGWSYHTLKSAGLRIVEGEAERYPKGRKDLIEKSKDKTNIHRLLSRGWDLETNEEVKFTWTKDLEIQLAEGEKPISKPKITTATAPVKLFSPDEVGTEPYDAEKALEASKKGSAALAAYFKRVGMEWETSKTTAPVTTAPVTAAEPESDAYVMGIINRKKAFEAVGSEQFLKTPKEKIEELSEYAKSLFLGQIKPEHIYTHFFSPSELRKRGQRNPTYSQGATLFPIGEEGNPKNSFFIANNIKMSIDQIKEKLNKATARSLSQKTLEHIARTAFGEDSNSLDAQKAAIDVIFIRSVLGLPEFLPEKKVSK